MMSIVRKKRGGRRAYVPSTSGSKGRGGGRRGRRGGGWVGEGRTRQDEEREERPDQTRAGIKGEKRFRFFG